MAASDYYTKTALVAQTLARASQVNANLSGVEAGFGRLPDRAVLDTGRVTFAVDTGAADVYAVALHKTASAYYDGMSITMRVSATNTGACTVNVDGLGAKAIKLTNGTDPAAGDLTDGDFQTLVYDADAGYFRIISLVRSVINGQASMSDAEIKAAYENNADTNAYTDAEQTKLGHLAVTGAVDLDVIAGLTATTSGSVSIGDALSVNSDATVSKLGQGTTPVHGTPSEFNDNCPTSTGGCPPVYLGNGKALICYADADASNVGKAVVATFVEGDPYTSVVYGTAYQFEAGATKEIEAALIAPNKVLVVYVDGGNSDRGTMVVLTVHPDGEVVPGTPVVFQTSTTGKAAVAKLDNDRAVVADSVGAVRVVTVEGDVPTAASAATFDTTSATDVEACSVGTDRFFLAYQSGANSNYFYGRAGIADGTTIALGTAVIHDASTLGTCSCCQIGDNEIVMQAASKFRAAKLEGASFAFETAVAGPTTYGRVVATPDTLAYVTTDTLASYSISGVSLAVVGASSVASFSGIGAARVCAIGDRKFLMTEIETTTADGHAWVVDARPMGRERFVGYAAEAKADAQTVKILPPKRKVAGQTGLTTGRAYFFDRDGSLTTKNTGYPAGIATSSTEIITP